MSATPDNPPAFPRTGEGFGNTLYDTAGMSLRDWFAGQALSSEAMFRAYHSTPGLMASYAYEVADAMLAERVKAVSP